MTPALAGPSLAACQEVIKPQARWSSSAATPAVSDRATSRRGSSAARPARRDRARPRARRRPRPRRAENGGGL